MGEEVDILTTKTGNWSAARIRYATKLIDYLSPEGRLEKAKRYFRGRYREPMSENQWSKVTGARGESGENFMHDLIESGVMVPDGTESNGNRHYDVYSVDFNRLCEKFYESEVGCVLVDSSEIVINKEVPKKKVERQI